MRSSHDIVGEYSEHCVDGVILRLGNSEISSFQRISPIVVGEHSVELGDIQWSLEKH